MGLSHPKPQGQRVVLGSSQMEQDRGWQVTSGTSTSKPHGQGEALGSSTPKPLSLGAEQRLVGLSHPQTPWARGGLGVKPDGEGRTVVDDTGVKHPKISWSCSGGGG